MGASDQGEKVFAGKETDRAADKSHLHAITLRVAANYSISHHVFILCSGS